MSFIKIKKSQLSQLIESLLFEQEILYKTDPNDSSYEYAYHQNSEDIFITKSPKKSDTTREKPAIVKKDSNAYNAIKNFFKNELSKEKSTNTSDTAAKVKPVADDKKLKAPFMRIATVHRLIEDAINEAITLTDPKIKDLLDKIPTGDQGIKDVITKSTQNGKFKFGYMIDNLEDKIAVIEPSSQPLRKQNPFSVLAGKVNLQNKEIQKAYTLMMNGYANLDGDSFVRLQEVTDAILDIYLRIIKRSLNSLRSGNNRQQRKNRDEISTLESLNKAIENYKAEIKGYIGREAKAYSLIFDEITKTGNVSRAKQFLKYQGFTKSS